MTDYISREAALKDFEASNAENPRWTPQRVKTLLLRQHAADVTEVVHGRWCVSKIRSIETVFYCSECKRTVTVGNDFFGEAPQSVSAAYPYCHCGAKMDGGDGSVADDLERKLAETGKLVPRLYGDYVFSPCQNAFNGKTSWWLSKKDCTVAIYCFTAGTTAEVDAQLSAGGEQAYIQMFKERTGFRKKPARLAADFPVKYTEICALYHFCVDLGIKCTIERLHDGYAVRFPDGSDFAQHHGTYGGTEGCVEPAIGDSEFDYTAVGLNLAKELVKKHKANTASIRQIQGGNGNVSD